MRVDDKSIFIDLIICFCKMDDLHEVLAGFPQEVINKLEGMCHFKHVNIIVMLAVVK